MTIMTSQVRTYASVRHVEIDWMTRQRFGPDRQYLNPTLQGHHQLSWIAHMVAPLSRMPSRRSVARILSSEHSYLVD